MRFDINRLGRRVKEESFRSLVLEAILRCFKRGRRIAFPYLLRRSIQLHYRPLQYYKLDYARVPADVRESVISYADRVIGGEFPMMGYGNPQLGFPPKWNVDWVSGKEWPCIRADQLTTVCIDGSDVKAPWELSRLQYLPVLGKAYCLTGKKAYREAVMALASDWINQNPVGKGINWTIAMEAAIRSISICLALELLWPFDAQESAWLADVTRSLWEHMIFIEANSEFSHLIRSNHFLSNIVGLTTLAAVLDAPGMNRRFRRYSRAVQKELLLQTYIDGGDYEASTGYHVLVSQMFLHSWMVQRARRLPMDVSFEERLAEMFTWLADLADSRGQIPHLGDCDDGRVELLHDEIEQAALPLEERNSLHVSTYLGLASALLGMRISNNSKDLPWYGLTANETLSPGKPVSLLKESGIAVLRQGNTRLVASAMPNGISGRGSHTHCDKLSFVFDVSGYEVFSDSGTCVYTRDRYIRNRFRATASHNTLMIDGEDQNTLSADPTLLFKIGNDAAVYPWSVEEETGHVRISSSHCGYERLGCRHRREFTLDPVSLSIEDVIEGTGDHAVDLFFILGPDWTVLPDIDGPQVQCQIRGPMRLSLTCRSAATLQLQVAPHEISRTYGSFLPATRIRIHANTSLPTRLSTTIRSGEMK